VGSRTGLDHVDKGKAQPYRDSNSYSTAVAIPTALSRLMDLVAQRLEKHNFDLVGVQKIIWVRVCQTIIYSYFLRNGEGE
jgi:hypothetical protein